MSRVIKFRTFYRGKMEILGGFSDHIFFDDDGMQTIQCDMHLMQFTGLQDKNGKDIYEGDVVEIIDHGRGCGAIEHNNTHTGFVWHCWTGKEFCKGEIVGNIHENPELLKINKEK